MNKFFIYSVILFISVFILTCIIRVPYFERGVILTTKDNNLNISLVIKQTKVVKNVKYIMIGNKLISKFIINVKNNIILDIAKKDLAENSTKEVDIYGQDEILLSYLFKIIVK